MFGLRVGPDGILYDTGSVFALGQVVAWRADLGASVGAGEIRFQVVEIRSDGQEIAHWDETFVPLDPRARFRGRVADLALYAHDGPGHDRFMYLRGSALVAAGEFTLTPPS